MNEIDHVWSKTHAALSAEARSIGQDIWKLSKDITDMSDAKRLLQKKKDAIESVLKQIEQQRKMLLPDSLQD